MLHTFHQDEIITKKDGKYKKERDSDSQLRKLRGDQARISVQIVQREKEIKKELGLVVDSIDDLVCPRHPDAEFEVEGQIPDSHVTAHVYWKKDALNIYHCRECNEGKHRIIRTKAYDCPVCDGIVLGDFVTRPYDEIGPLSGSRGDRHYCRLCNTQLGQSIFEHS